MTQAYYAPENFGHFGLNLPRYGHFTSPIRRYADLVVHRALIRAHGWGKDGLTHDEEVAAARDRRAHLDDRAPLDDGRARHHRPLPRRLPRPTASAREFAGTVAGVARFGLFVKLDETGADGLVPISSLGREYFAYDPDAQTLTGEKSRRVIGLGQRVLVRLAEAAPITGGLLFELLEVEGRKLPTPPRAAIPRAPRAGNSPRAGSASAPTRNETAGPDRLLHARATPGVGNRTLWIPYGFHMVLGTDEFMRENQRLAYCLTAYRSDRAASLPLQPRRRSGIPDR